MATPLNRPVHLVNFIRTHERETVSIGLLIVFALCAGAVLAYNRVTVDKALLFVSQSNAIVVDIDGAQATPLPPILPRRLDGMMVASEDANRVPVCVMIENAAFSGVRPQSGLSHASVVYEVVVEGGITRLMAVYAGEQSPVVGPVRSARDTYLEFVSEYDCAYVHAGGSFTAMQAIPRFELRDVDGLREGKYFYRDSSKGAPHNLFTSTEELYRAVEEHGWTTDRPPQYESWLFTDDLYRDSAYDSSAAGAVDTIEVLFGGSYNVQYTYNPEQNTYNRLNGGVQQIDAATGSPLTTRTIVVQHVGEGQYIEGKGRVNWPVTGEGIVEIFHDGAMISGTWKKPTRTDRTVFVDANGNPIPLVRGAVWVEVVPEGIPTAYH